MILETEPGERKQKCWCADELIAWAAFAGAWLLVAGPLYQGALELREQDIDREGLEASKARVEPPKMPSPWWWLVPPVFYLLRRQHGRQLEHVLVLD
jgi:hypothetical protein